MLNDIVTAINILQEIKKICDQLKSNLESLKQLGQRVAIFNELLLELKVSFNNRVISTSLEDSLKALNPLLLEIKEYIEDHLIQETKSKSKLKFAKRLLINIAFRNQIENDINSFTERINEVALVLQPSLAINIENQRRLDNENLKIQLDSTAEETM